MARILLLFSAAAAIVAAPTFAGPRSAASTRALDLRLLDEVKTVACPPGSGSAECYSLSSSTRSIAFGAVRVGPFTDVEVDASDPHCHQPITAKDTLTFSGGSLTVDVTGPQLCYGLVETVPRTFTVTGGTGIFSGATGQGQAPISLLPSGASEHWQGSIQAPNLPPIAEPSVSVESIHTARQAKKRESFTLRFLARANGWPSSLRYTVVIRSGLKARTKSGSLARSGTAQVVLTMPHAKTAALELNVTGSGSEVTLHRRVHER